jgi:chromate reductase
VRQLPLRFIGFAGSLRAGSYNRSLLRAAGELLPEDVEMETFDIEGIPLYNDDLLKEAPSRVRLFKDRIRASDAVLIVTPEYNYSIPRVLKNAIDWASRPYADNALAGKPVAVMSASTGMLGGARAQYHLRQSFVYLDMHPINKPEVIVTYAAKKFVDGRLTDEKTREKVIALLATLRDWTIRLGTKPS